MGGIRRTAAALAMPALIIVTPLAARESWECWVRVRGLRPTFAVQASLPEMVGVMKSEVPETMKLKRLYLMRLFNSSLVFHRGGTVYGRIANSLMEGGLGHFRRMSPFEWMCLALAGIALGAVNFMAWLFGVA